ncbi:MAG: HEAT repeat domain-containing protein [Pleurocapsa minor GSE-CHR-MK-17-07R]|jgi:HEAT repeat protein|nr:HEAT repeat domain-containing protein [Pleurocapsa minor GSE-CHR-MK 17-07R]
MTHPEELSLKQALSELRDTNKEKRRTAVMKLGMMGGDEAVRTLITIVRNDNEDLIVRGRAALMLGKLGDQRAVDPLIDALQAPGFQTRVNAAQSLGRLGDPRAIAPLMKIVQNEADTFRETAADALKRLGCDPDMVQDTAHDPRASLFAQADESGEG